MHDPHIFVAAPAFFHIFPHFLIIILPLSLYRNSTTTTLSVTFSLTSPSSLPSSLVSKSLKKSSPRRSPSPRSSRPSHSPASSQSSRPRTAPLLNQLLLLDTSLDFPTTSLARTTSKALKSINSLTSQTPQSFQTQLLSIEPSSVGPSLRLMSSTLPLRTSRNKLDS